MSLVEAFRDLDARDYCEAVNSVLETGGPAEVIVPGLVAAVTKVPLKGDSKAVMAAFGPPVISYLVEALKHPDESVRHKTTCLLAEIGGRAGSAARALIPALEDPSRWVRIGAARALGEIRAPFEVAGPALTRALSDQEIEVRVAAGRALWVTGGPAELVASVLVPVLTEPVWLYRWLALNTLAEMAEPIEVIAPVMVGALADANEYVRELAHVALSDLRSRAIPFLNSARRHPRAEVRAAVLQVLMQFAPEALLADPEPVGIERTGDEALRLIGALEVFYRVGELCRSRNSDVFVFKAIPRLLRGREPQSVSLSVESIRRHLAAVSSFFKEYFKQFEGLDIADDDCEVANNDDKLIARCSGKPPRICPLGWRAWDEVRRYLAWRGRIASDERATG